jgi:polo-like kinase 1
VQPDEAPFQAESSGCVTQLISEIKIHESLHHSNIVEFRHTFEDNLNVYILLELCTNHTLNDLLKRKKRLTEP